MKENDTVIGWNERESICMPKKWMFCFNNNCHVKESCFRHFAAMNFSSDRERGYTVFPQMVRDGRCKFYIETQKEVKACGLTKLYDNVNCRDARVLRNALYEMLGSKRNYFRYNSGERWLSVRLQQKIRNLFKSYGYENVEFEHYMETYNYECE